MKNKLYLIIHGHFYQPPREDPWTMEIDRQTSASPYHDWNVRIDRECYAANAASRVLDGFGRIEAIINNYSYISFNIGPTLMSWLKKYDNYTYKKIIQADYESRERNNGHGNAIAQVYNHMIMPLASDNDLITQIEWGIKSFKSDFNRDPEGIWLAETAINDRVAEFLINYGIKFVILSPTQAKEIRAFNSDHWIDVSNNNIDPSKPYVLKESNGSINVFFYYGDLAAKVSFHHLLRSVDYLRKEILSNNKLDKEIHLVHYATDGEVYGHHEPFGDMCLSRLIYENEINQDFIFTNYGNILDIIKPEYYVRLKEGNDGLGTAWSCSHGIDRWRKDCGCSTGAPHDWNQKWREPLRNAFDYLRDRLYELAEKELSQFFNNIWNARNDFIDVVYSTNIEERLENINKFFIKYNLNNLSELEKSNILKLLEALHYEMLMYTSCGWFFSDISGLEPVQNLKYAARLIDLISDFLPPHIKENFLSILYNAKSNIQEFQNGKWIYENFVEKNIFSECHVINEVLLSNLVYNTLLKNSNYKYSFYDIYIKNYEVVQKEDWNIYKIELKLKNNLILQEFDYISYVFQNGYLYKTFIKKYLDESLMYYLDKIIERDNVRYLIRDFQDWFLKSYSLNDLKYDTKEKLLLKMFEKSMIKLHKNLSIDFNDLEEYLETINLYHELGIVLPEKDISGIIELLNNYIIREIYSIKSFDEYDFSKLIKIIQITKRANLQLDYTDILIPIRNYILNNLENVLNTLDPDELKRIEKIIDFTNLSGLDFEKYEIQNLIYEKLNEIINNINISQEKITLLFRLASKFNIAIYKFESKLRKLR